MLKTHQHAVLMQRDFYVCPSLPLSTVMDALLLLLH